MFNKCFEELNVKWIFSTYRLIGAGAYPNTYTFSKQIAENVVEILGEGLPIGIFRPAIGK